VLYSSQKVSLLVTHETVPPKHNDNFLISVLKLILLTVTLVTVLGIARPQGKSEQRPVARQASVASAKEMFLKYCASCHGQDGKGGGPAAVAMKPPPSDLTTISKRHDGKYPAGYVGAVLKFGRSLASHGSYDCRSGDRALRNSTPFTTQRANNTSTMWSLTSRRCRRNNCSRGSVSLVLLSLA
jgi:hypothetical protein